MRMKKKLLTPQKNIDRDLILLLVIGGLYALGIFLSNTFVNVYLWKNSESYFTLGVYNLAIYLLQPITFIFAGILAKKIDRVLVLRIGVICLSLFFMTVLLIGEKAPHFNFLLGSLLGIGYGFYWLAYNVLTFEITEPHNRDFFNGFLGILESFSGMAGPLFAGLVISKLQAFSGYTAIFLVSFLLFLLAVITSFFLKRRGADGAFCFRDVLLERKHNRKWRGILHAHLLQGLREGIFLFLITIWVFLITKSELSLGMFNLLLSGMSLIVYFCAAKWIKHHHRKKAILIGGIALYLAIFILINPFHASHIFIYALVIGIAYPIINIPYVSLTYDVIGKARNAKDWRVEYIVVRELYVNIGRILSIAVFLIAITFVHADTAIPYLLLIFGAGHAFIYWPIKDIRTRTNPGSQAKKQTEMAIDEKNR